MKQRELYEKVQLLKAGQVVEIADDCFQAVKVEDCDIVDCCQLCDLDSICHDDVFDVCCEMEAVGSFHWILKLAHPA